MGRATIRQTHRPRLKNFRLRENGRSHSGGRNLAQSGRTEIGNRGARPVSHKLSTPEITTPNCWPSSQCRIQLLKVPPTLGAASLVHLLHAIPA
jgi:hypothetical protein